MRNVWFTVSLALISALVLTSGLTFYYYSRYVTAEKQYLDTLSSLNEVSYKVNILINYGNGTKRWYNQTTIPIGWSFLNATLKATEGKVEGTWYPFGVFVTSINGVRGTGQQFWLWFHWDKAKGKWLPCAEAGQAAVGPQPRYRPGTTGSWSGLFAGSLFSCLHMEVLPVTLARLANWSP